MISGEVVISLYLCVEEDMGIYPSGWYKNYGKDDQTFTKRTEWQEGYNAAVMDFSEKRALIFQWYEELSDPIKELVGTLVVNEDLVISTRDGKINLWVDCSDIFAWGCADSERIETDQLSELEDFVKKDEKWGSYKWCMKRRNEHPQWPVEKSMKDQGSWEDWLDDLPENKSNAWEREHYAK